VRDPVTGASSGERTGKPGGGDLDAGAPSPVSGVADGDVWEQAREVDVGTVPARPGVPVGKGKTGRGSSLVRKSSSCGGGEDRRRENGKVVSSKTTCRETMTRLVVRSRHV